ncbi:hypothetical protein [Microvirga mediterraneensis]|uniref:Terminase small subunit n=1 Tax=Microvirga mediterraneensis TaxID=2754695 RepID=A0A838BNJ8_9HYPH|nr:hypothetical protein [Microvirga mediterraneensis]MBA1156921.1 hypothetical protein [Microvirga mediterraneensis]
MPALANNRHEIFAQELAKGKSQVEAYETAGFKNGQKNAHRLGTDEGILRRVAEIQSERAEMDRKATEKATEALAIDKQWVMARLVENVDRAMQAEAVLDNEGKPTGEYKYQGSVANKALELLGKELGMFIERTENVHVVHDITDEPLSPDQWADQHTTPH